MIRHEPDPHAPHPDDAAVFAAREADWRCGALVYQVLVDRFAPPADLAAKAHLYPAPKVLRGWHETPQRGENLEAARLWSHEIEFWGGDLASAASRLDHLQQLGADVVYLNPIHLAYTNHKYDALDYLQVSPEFGTRDDLRQFADAVHARGMKLVLDGVFNHMGRNAPIFQAAQADAASPWRSWFDFGEQHPGGARTWWLSQNLPELNLENPAVHDEKPGALVVGEIASYPAEWFGSIDAVMNFTLRDIILRTCGGRLDAATAMRMVHRLVDDAGIEPMLKSWTFLDNHDTPRQASTLPEPRARRLAQVLQFCLPGAPNLYYGGELGMAGSDDPEMRAPMRWDLVTDDNPDLAWTRALIALRRGQRALRVGNLRAVTSHRLLAFERHTDRVEDTVIVITNTSDTALTETVMTGNSRLMNTFRMLDLLGTAAEPVHSHCGLLTVTVPARGFLVLQPEVRPAGGYSSYKRVP